MLLTIRAVCYLRKINDQNFIIFCLIFAFHRPRTKLKRALKTNLKKGKIFDD